MQTTITKEERQQASQQIVGFILAKHVFQDDPAGFIRTVYNHAVEDLADALNVLANHNPEHRIAYRLAAGEFRANYPLIPGVGE